MAFQAAPSAEDRAAKRRETDIGLSVSPVAAVRSLLRAVHVVAIGMFGAISGAVLGILISLAVVIPLFRTVNSAFVVVDEFGEPDPTSGLPVQVFTLAVLACPCMGALIMAALLIRFTRSPG